MLIRNLQLASGATLRERPPHIRAAANRDDSDRRARGWQDDRRVAICSRSRRSSGGLGTNAIPQRRAFLGAAAVAGSTCLLHASSGHVGAAAARREKGQSE